MVSLACELNIGTGGPVASETPATMRPVYDQTFPAPLVYLDHAASTPLHPDLQAQLAEVWRYGYLNPAAGHPAAYAMRQQLARLTAEFLAALDTPDARIVWTSGGTEANNLALFGTVAARCGTGPVRLVTTVAEHPSVTEPVAALARQGATIDHVPLKRDGALDLHALGRLLRPDTALVSLALVQSETGVVRDLVAVRRLLDQRAPQAVFHADAVQALAKVPLPWQAAGLDLVSLSAHKIHGPGGVGALVLRPGRTLQPQVLGGGQQDNLRSGSLDAAGIVGFCLAYRLLREEAAFLPRVAGLNTRLRAGLARLTGRDGRLLAVDVISPPAASPFILCVALPSYEGAVVMRLLGERGVMVATGSACSADQRHPSATLLAMGHSREMAFGALRISLGQTTTAADLDTFLATLQTVLQTY